VVGMYVDDQQITGASYDDIKLFKKEMAAAFKMSDLCLLHYYHGIEVKQGACGILLSQGWHLAQPRSQNRFPAKCPWTPLLSEASSGV
jgi:hypothetical protein